MEADRRTLRRRRRPLSDCTNTINTRSSASSSSSTTTTTTTTSLIKPSKFLPSPIFKKPENKNINSDTNIDSHFDNNNNNGNNNNHADNDGPNPTSVDSLPSTPLRSSNSSSTSTDIGEPMTVYTRRQTAAEKRKKKGKMVDAPLSCLPVERLGNISDVRPCLSHTLFAHVQHRDKLGEVGDDEALRIAPRKKKRLQLPPEKDVSKHALPEDYIKQQRAYFAEIDAFELTEEVVSEGELD